MTTYKVVLASKQGTTGTFFVDVPMAKQPVEIDNAWKEADKLRKESMIFSIIKSVTEVR